MPRRLQCSLLAIGGMLGIARGDSGSLPAGTYDLERAPKTTHWIRGTPPCGDEAAYAFSDLPKLTVVYDTSPKSAVVNKQAWTILETSNGTFAAKQITSCRSVTLELRAHGESATGVLVYVSKCPDGKAIQCATAADYRGTFRAKPTPP